MKDLLQGAREGMVWSAIMSITMIIGYLLIVNYAEFWF
jgi:hypothetical protein